MSDKEFLEQFESRTLDRKEWTHEAHIRMAWLYLKRSDSYRRARSRIRSGIKKLNAAFEARLADPCGAIAPPEASAMPADEPKRVGYHETITTAFVRLIAVRIRSGETYTKFQSRNVDLFDGKLSALMSHYSAGLLFSEEARTSFVEPDLARLPKPWLALV
jgi:hypothetical protein